MFWFETNELLKVTRFLEEKKNAAQKFCLHSLNSGKMYHISTKATIFHSVFEEIGIEFVVPGPLLITYSVKNARNTMIWKLNCVILFNSGLSYIPTKSS